MTDDDEAEDGISHEEWLKGEKPDWRGVRWPRGKPVCNDSNEECPEMRWTLGWLSSRWPYAEWTSERASCPSSHRHGYRGEVNGCTIRIDPGNIEVVVDPKWARSVSREHTKALAQKYGRYDVGVGGYHVDENEAGSAAEDEAAIARAVTFCFELGPQYDFYLDSPAWQAKRKEILKRDRHSCVRCGGAKILQVHHLTYARLGREKPEDLVTLCKGCHEREHKDHK